jgi:hypothetical protein
MHIDYVVVEMKPCGSCGYGLTPKTSQGPRATARPGSGGIENTGNAGRGRCQGGCIGCRCACKGARGGMARFPTGLYSAMKVSEKTNTLHLHGLRRSKAMEHPLGAPKSLGCGRSAKLLKLHNTRSAQQMPMGGRSHNNDPIIIPPTASRLSYAPCSLLRACSNPKAFSHARYHALHNKNPTLQHQDWFR